MKKITYPKTPTKPLRGKLAKGAKQLMLNPAYNQALYNQLNP